MPYSSREDWDFDPRYGFGPRSRSSRWVDPQRTKSKSQYPYSYDEFYLYGNAAARENSDAAYSDRIWQWMGHDKAEALWKRLVGCRWEQATPEQLSAFLSAWLDKPVVLTALAEGCNASNGYPYWIVWWKPRPSRANAGKGGGRG